LYTMANKGRELFVSWWAMKAYGRRMAWYYNL
jgi:hypothetical protein